MARLYERVLELEIGVLDCHNLLHLLRVAVEKLDAIQS